MCSSAQSVKPVTGMPGACAYSGGAAWVTGSLRAGYTGTTLRDNLGLPVPAAAGAPA
jgi:hypothetical protein